MGIFTVALKKLCYSYSNKFPNFSLCGLQICEPDFSLRDCRQRTAIYRFAYPNQQSRAPSCDPTQVGTVVNATRHAANLDLDHEWDWTERARNSADTGRCWQKCRRASLIQIKVGRAGMKLGETWASGSLTG